MIFDTRASAALILLVLLAIKSRAYGFLRYEKALDIGQILAMQNG